jgi:hypothetical protein
MQLLLSSILKREKASAMTRARERVREGESACERESARPHVRGMCLMCVMCVCVCV